MKKARRARAKFKSSISQPSAIDAILNQLEEVRVTGPDQWMAKCPAHSDNTPSLSIKQTEDTILLHCFAGCDTDTICEKLGLELKDLFTRTSEPSFIRFPKPEQRTIKECSSNPIEVKDIRAHLEDLQKLNRLPRSLEGRGFILQDLEAVRMVARGENVLIPIYNPLGKVTRIKVRHFHGTVRYSYLAPGEGTPAWCSPGFQQHDTIMVVEGELNAIIAYCVHPNMAYMGIAGVGGCLWLSALQGKTVYLYADGDEPGRKALDNWAKAAQQAGAKRVLILESLPFPMDFCDLAGQQGRDALKALLPC
jgi:DNA primase